MYILKFIKRNSLSIIFMIFLFFLVIFSSENLKATKEGLILWSKNIVPSLLPFFIATELLNYTNITYIFKRFFSKLMQPLFNIPGEGAYAFLMGIVSGYPVGAKIVCDLYAAKICNQDEAERMLAFTNNSGPLFIIGTVGTLLFGNTSIGFLLFITHIMSSITVGIIIGILSRLRGHSSSKSNVFQDFNNTNTNSTLSNLGNILSASISKAIQTTLQIGGFVIFFSVILSILNRLNIIGYICTLLDYFSIPKSISNGLISGIIELTNGIQIISNLHVKNISTNIIICSFLLGFGGFSVFLQVLGIISKYKLHIKIYLYGKILQGLIASYYTYIFISKFTVFKLDLPPNNFITFPYLSVAILALFAIILIVKNIKITHNTRCT